MPTDSKYTDKIIAFMKREDRPVTTTEIQEAVGLSRQGAYWWIGNAGKHLVMPVGEGRNSATAYVLREQADKYPSNFTPHGTWTVKSARGAGKTVTPDFRLGATFQVVAMRIENGDTLVDMQGEEGPAFTVNVGAT